MDAATLIKRLVRAGKHAELWSQKESSAQNQKQKASCIKDENKSSNKGQKQGLMKGLEVIKNQQNFPFNLQEDEDFLGDDEEEEDYDDDEEEELRIIREKANQINLLRQQAAAAMEGNNAKKGFGAMAAAGSNNGKMNGNNNGGNANNGKKGANHHPNQNMGMKANPGGIDQKTVAAALKMNNGQLSGSNINPGEVKLGNDISSMMNLAGFHGNGATNNLASAMGGNPNIPGNFNKQMQTANNGFMGSSSAGFPTSMASGNQPSPVMMNMNGGYLQQQYPQSSSMLMNLQNRHAMQQQQQQQQQPQMMYNRSPYIPSSTGYYYYNYGPSPYSAFSSYYPPADYYHNGSGGGDQSATHMFSDDNAGSCSIM